MIRAAYDDGARARLSTKAPVPLLFTSTNVHKRYLPGRGIVWSILGHSAVIYGLLFIPVSAHFTEPVYQPLRVTMINLRDPNYRLYLPVLMGADPPPERAPETASSVVETKSNVTSDDRASRLSYPGPQPIVSDFPKPTNHIQTILQPALNDPPTLPPPIILPNIVRMPEMVPPPMRSPKLLEAVKPPDVQQPRPPIPPEVKTIELPANVTSPPINISKVVLPATGAASIPDVAPPELAASKTEGAPVPETALARQQASVPDTPVTKPVEPLLTLSPMPSPPDDMLKVPVGEARGRFSISPDPNLTGSDKEDGAKTDRVSSATGIRTGTDTVNAASSGNGTAPLGTSSVKGKAAASASSDAGASLNRLDKGPTAGSGSSADSGKNKNAFAGITILPSGAGANPISATGTPAPLQTSYGVTIVSTESSGGGLPQFGIFSNEQVFTVYVDMRRTITDPAPSWTFEYAILKGTAAQPNVVTLPKKDQQGIVLPFPTVKEQPALPAELARKYLRNRIIVYAVINVEGKMEQMAVKESPDPLLNESILRALTKWLFRPAQLDGENVAVKALIGIPVFMPQ